MDKTKEKGFVECYQCKLSFWLKMADRKTRVFCCRNILSVNVFFDEFNNKSLIMRTKNDVEGCHKGVKKFIYRILFWK